MKNLLYIVLITISGTLFGQQVLMLQKSNSYLIAGTSSANRDINQPHEAIGSPYIQENYLYAFVDNLNKPYKIRYNAFTDEMEFDNNGVAYDLDKSQYKVINFEDFNKKYIVANYNEGNSMHNGYLVEVIKGLKVSLYKREKVEYFEGKKTATGFGVDTPPEFKVKKNAFFVKLNEGEIMEIPNSTRKFSDLFGYNSKRINKFIKENKISLNSENDLKQLFQYLNSI